MKKNLLKTGILFLIMAFSFGTFAQSITIMGEVTDAEGLPISGQEVLIMNNDSSNFVLVAVTNLNGFYQVSFVNAENIESLIVQAFNENCDEYFSEFVQINPNQNEYTVDFSFCANNVPTECVIDFFYYQPNNDLTVEFEGFSSDTLYGWTWNLYGDVTATGQFVSVDFPGEGEYEVTVSATSDECGTISATQLIFIDDAPLGDTTRCFADFYYMIDSINPNLFTFIDQSWGMGEITSYEWDFGDGTTDNGEFVQHEYTEEGEYFVALTITAGDCSATWEDVVYVGENTWYPEDCQAFFMADYDYENYQTVNFEDLSWGANGQIMAWEWSFGDNTASSLQNPSHTYNTDGEYLVTLTIFADSCTSTFEQVVYIEDYEWGDCQTIFYPEFRDGLGVQFYNLSQPEPTENYWLFGDGETSEEAEPFHVYTEEGIYFVTLFTGIDSCFSAFEMEIQVGLDNSKMTSEIIRAYAITSEGSPIATSVENVNFETSISLYPNPVSDKLNININENVNNVNVSIYSITGQLVITNNFNQNNITINTANLNSGLYVAKIMVDGKSSSVKFVK